MSIVTAAAIRTPLERWRGWLRLLLAAGVITALVVRFGAGPFVDAFRAVDPWTVIAAVAIAAGITACCAYRWCTVASAMGVPVRLSEAVPAYFRSQFLNATLPGGVLGDVHRGLRQHRAGRPLGRALRAVAWERTLGQAVQILLAAAALVALPSPVRARLPIEVRIGVLAGLALMAALALAARLRRSHITPACIAAAPACIAVAHSRVGPARPGCADPVQASPRTATPPGDRARRALAADWRAIRSVRHGLPVVAALSAGAAAGHVGVFLLAARSVDPGIAASTLIPIALVVMVVAALPINLAGWGPREGAAAWVFDVAGLGAAQGLSISVLYGVLALVGTLPGALVLLIRHREGAA